MTEREYTIILTPDEKQGGYTATVPALPECVAQGGTLDEAIANAQDAIQDYIDALAKDRHPIPEEHTHPIPEEHTHSQLATVRVTA
jgi:predicted RNase H-like HicB family nuclease